MSSQIKKVCRNLISDIQKEHQDPQKVVQVNGPLHGLSSGLVRRLSVYAVIRKTGKVAKSSDGLVNSWGPGCNHKAFVEAMK